MSRVWDVWPAERGRNAKRATLADSAEAAACEIGEEFVAEGVLSVGAAFDLCVAADNGDISRFRAHTPPAFVLEDVECCSRCGVSDADEPATDWDDVNLCAACADADES